MTWLKNLWYDHIQEVLGTFEWAFGLLEFIDAQTINLVGSFFGPKYGPLVSKGLQCGAGLAIALRARQVRRERPSG